MQPNFRKSGWILLILFMGVCFSCSKTSEPPGSTEDVRHHIRRGNTEEVKLHIEQPRNEPLADGQGVPLIVYAASGGPIEILELLLANGADVNARHPDANSTVLEMALSRKEIDRIALLKEYGVDTDQRFADGSTPQEHIDYFIGNFSDPDIEVHAEISNPEEYTKKGLEFWLQAKQVLFDAKEE